MSSNGETIMMRLLSSKVKGELLVLFHRNPGLMDSTEGIAKRIGRSATAIQLDLDDLVEMGVLGKKAVGSSEIVFLDRRKDKEVIDLVGVHLQHLPK